MPPLAQTVPFVAQPDPTRFDRGDSRLGKIEAHQMASVEHERWRSLGCRCADKMWISSAVEMVSRSSPIQWLKKSQEREGGR